MTEYFYTATFELRSFGPRRTGEQPAEGFTSGIHQSESATAKQAFVELECVLLKAFKSYTKIKTFQRM